MTEKTTETKTQDTPQSPEEEVKSLLQFDPFEVIENEPAAEADPSAAAGTDGGEGTEKPVAAASDADPEQDETDGGKPEPVTKEPAQVDDEAARELAILREKIKTLEATQTTVKEKPAAEAAPEDDGVPEYTFNMPAQFTAMLDSENPAERHAAVAVAMTSVAKTVHRNVINQVRELVTKGVPQMIEQRIAQQTQAQIIHNDFYGKNPDLKELAEKEPALYGTITSIAKNVQEELKIGWSPALRDEIEKRVRAVLRIPRKAAPAKKPGPKIFDGTPRAAASPKQSEADDIVDTLFGQRRN